MAIEILENTLLKLLVRRGTDSDRKQITLESGELGFTTDTDRLYIGNSTTPGGVVVGNIYKGKVADVTSLTPVVTGDYAYETDTNSLKICVGGTGAVATDWLTVSNLVSAGNTTITIDSANRITVGTLSAGNFAADALGSSIEIDGSNKIALSGTVNIDSITQRTTGLTNYVSIPSKLKINSINYDFPPVGPGNNSFLGSDADGSLSWSIPNLIESTVAPTTASVIPVATIVPFASAAADVPYGWLSCDGSEYISTAYPDLSAAIGIGYNTGGETSTDYFRVPNLNNKTVYGAANPAATSLVGVTTGAATTLGSGLSATGIHFMIKSIGGVTSPTLTVQKNLTAFVNSVDKTSVAFNPLSGAVVIERPPPGQETFTTGGDTYTFTMPAGIHYVKFYVTGAGAKGGSSPGGASATAVGYLSAAPGTEFKVKVANGPTAADAPVSGDSSAIYPPGGTDPIVEASGGIYLSANFWRGNRSRFQESTEGVAGGDVVTTNAHVLNGYVIKGGSGMMDTDDKGDEESLGASSYWGSSPAPGGGQGAHGAEAFGAVPGNGIVMFEWS
tara:strand:- start:14774 stop:16453 length:1680 start_codon:yes stop_codon:yes gene_type:complete